MAEKHVIFDVFGRFLANFRRYFSPNLLIRQFQRTVNVRRLSAARLRKTAVGLRPLWDFSPPKFFVPVKCYAFSLSGTKNLRLQPGRYAKLGFELVVEYKEIMY